MTAPKPIFRRSGTRNRLIGKILIGPLACIAFATQVQAESLGGAAAGIDTPGRSSSSVAAILEEHAARELPPAELDRMRGGFLLFSGIAMNVRVEFAALVNGELAPVAVDPSVYGAPGIFTRLSDGVATVTGTNQFRGLVSAVQNNLDFQNFQSTTFATFDLSGSMASLRGGLMRGELNYTTTSFGLAR